MDKTAEAFRRYLRNVVRLAIGEDAFEVPKLAKSASDFAQCNGESKDNLETVSILSHDLSIIRADTARLSILIRTSI